MRDARQRLVHRHMHIGIAGDALHVAERLLHRLAERDADVLGGVVVVDVQVALGLDRDVDARVARQQIEHVVEEADAGRNRRDAPAVEVDFDLDVGFLGLALHRAFAHGESFDLRGLLSGLRPISPLRRRPTVSGGGGGADHPQHRQRTDAAAGRPPLDRLAGRQADQRSPDRRQDRDSTGVRDRPHRERPASRSALTGDIVPVRPPVEPMPIAPRRAGAGIDDVGPRDFARQKISSPRKYLGGSRRQAVKTLEIALGDGDNRQLCSYFGHGIAPTRQNAEHPSDCLASAVRMWRFTM